MSRLVTYLGAPSWFSETLAGTRAVFFSNSPFVQMKAVADEIGIGLAPCCLGDDWPGLERLSSAAAPALRPVWMIIHRDLRRVVRVGQSRVRSLARSRATSNCCDMARRARHNCRRRCGIPRTLSYRRDTSRMENSVTNRWLSEAYPRITSENDDKDRKRMREVTGQYLAAFHKSTKQVFIKLHARIPCRCRCLVASTLYPYTTASQSQFERLPRTLIRTNRSASSTRIQRP
jgi:hypothetical protein